MIIQNNTVVISSSSPSSSSSTSSPSSTDSDWLEVKMETDESPEPDCSSTQSSPELLPDGSHSTIILTPPAAFADSSLQSQHGTPQQQIHGTPNILQNCGGTFTIPGRLPPPVLQGGGDSPAVPHPVSLAISSVDSNGPGVTENSSSSRVFRTEDVVETAASTMNTTSVLNRCTPSIMASVDSARGVRSPSSVPNSTRRTPIIVATDSVMGNTPFTARSPFSLQQSSGGNTTRRTPSLLVTDSIMGNSTFAARSSFSLQQPGSGNTTRRTPSLLVTDSVMGNSTFGVQSLSHVAHSQSNSAHRTPCIVVTNSVMGNSTMKTPPSPVPPAGSTSQSAADNHASENPSAGTPMWHESSAVPPQPSVPLPSATTLQTMTRADTEREMERSEQLMDVTPSPSNAVDELAECRAQMESFKNHGLELKEELHIIKGQFFELLNDLGLSHDIYYNAVTPAETPDLVQLNSQISTSIFTAAGSLARSQCLVDSPNNSTAESHSHVEKSRKMSTPRSTPRRGIHGRHHGIDMTTKYADLVLEQLLAKARTESNSSSSKSDSPPDLQSVANHGAEAVGSVPDRHLDDGPRNAGLPCNVDINKDSEDADPKGSAKSKVIPVYNGFEPGDDGDVTLLEHPERAVTEVHHGMLVPTVSPEVPLSTNTSSGSAPASSTGSSNNSSVPDLNKELVSRMQYYSDFTIDRQKKIDEAGGNLGAVLEVSDESSPPSTSPKEQSDERISPRCVEGSESTDLFKAPLPLSKPLVSAVPAKTVQSGFVRAKDKRGNLASGDANESDSSSGTGSMSGSQHSRPSSHCSLASKHSPRDRQSARSSSRDHRSSGSSRGSRCSTHPLASSTFISDPNSHSPGSGSVYTWSLDGSSDENLHQSFLRSEKRHHRRSRSSHRSSKSSRTGTTVASHGTTRPATVIGADSPPHEKQPGVDDTLHLTQEISVIDSPPRRFGGNRFENSMASSVTPRASSIPRTSTRIGARFLNMEGEGNHKASSSPELSNPCSDLNYAVSRIGPSNLSSDLQQPTCSDRSYSHFRDRPDLPGKSSTSESATSYHSQCLTCNPRLLASPADSSVRLQGSEDVCDEILTNSPNSYDSSGVQPPYNSYISPADSSNDYTTVSSSSQEHSIVASAPRQPRAFAVKSPSVFKVPFSPVAKTVKRKAGAGGHSTHNVGVRAVGTPHLPVGLLKHKEPVSRRKLFAAGQSQLTGTYHAPKILDRKALVRKFRKFSSNFKKDRDSAKFHTLANL